MLQRNNNYNTLTFFATYRTYAINFTDGDEDYGSGPYFIKLTAGKTHFPFKISILDDNRLEENENFFLTIDKSSLPCDITVGNQDQTTVTILEDDCK